MRLNEFTEQHVEEGSDNIEIGQQMANDGITYSPEKENELIDLMSQYMKNAGMSPKAIRYHLSYDEDYIPDQLRYLPTHGVAEGNLKEFAPGNGGGDSGRWYTDDQMTDLVGDGWWNDLDISGDVSKQEMIQQAQAWLDDQGYSVHVLNCKVNDDDMEWYIEGSFQNSNFAKKGMAEEGKQYDHRDPEHHELDAPRPLIYGLKINGKIWKKDGNTVTFFTKERAMAARNSILAKRPDVEVGLVQRPKD